MTATLTLNRTALLNKKLSVGKMVGNTPLYELSNVWRKYGVRIFAKLEWRQLGGSVKSRPAFRILKDALETGQLRNGKHLLDATSGNTGIAYATIGAALGVPITLCLPENASQERKNILDSLGANIIYTSRFEGTDGAQLTAKEIAKENPEKYYYADQYSNQFNWKAHFEGTAPEIWNQTSGKITHFVAGLGTTGTFTGTGRRLKHYNPEIELIALQPDNPMHGLEGWKDLETAKVPRIYDPKLADRFLQIETLEAYEMVRLVANKEGLLISPSAAANLCGAIKVAEQLDKGTVVTTFSDNADKYTEVLKQIF